MQRNLRQVYERHFETFDAQVRWCGDAAKVGCSWLGCADIGLYCDLGKHVCDGLQRAPCKSHSVESRTGRFLGQESGKRTATTTEEEVTVF